MLPAIAATEDNPVCPHTKQAGECRTEDGCRHTTSKHCGDDRTDNGQGHDDHGGETILCISHILRGNAQIVAENAVSAVLGRAAEKFAGIGVEGVAIIGAGDLGEEFLVFLSMGQVDIAFVAKDRTTVFARHPPVVMLHQSGAFFVVHIARVAVEELFYAAAIVARELRHAHVEVATAQIGSIDAEIAVQRVGVAVAVHGGVLLSDGTGFFGPHAGEGAGNRVFVGARAVDGDVNQGRCHARRVGPIIEHIGDHFAANLTVLVVVVVHAVDSSFDVLSTVSGSVHVAELLFPQCLGGPRSLFQSLPVVVCFYASVSHALADAR